MALGRQGERQAELMAGWTEWPRSPGHAFHDRLQAVLLEAGFDRFAEQRRASCCAARQGRPSLPPGRHFRLHPIGCLEGIDSKRGPRSGAAPAACPCDLLRLGTTGPVPDHSWLIRTRSRLPLEVPTEIFEASLGRETSAVMAGSEAARAACGGCSRTRPRSGLDT